MKCHVCQKCGLRYYGNHSTRLCRRRTGRKGIPMRSLSRLLRRYGACIEALQWAKGQPVSAATWRACKRGDWMLWIADRLGVGRKLTVPAACAFVSTALHRREKRLLKAVKTAAAYAHGEATDAEMCRAFADCTPTTAAEHAARVHAVQTLVHAAGNTARDLNDISRAVTCAASAHADAAQLVATPLRDFIYDEALNTAAHIVRRYIPWPVIKKALAPRRG